MIKVSELDQGFREEVAREPGGEKLLRCFACGTCTVSCPVREINDKYNPRRIIRMVLYGMKEQVLSSDFIWLCASCYSCQDRCPQGVKVTEIMTVLRNIAVKNGYIQPGFRKQAELVGQFGRLYEVEDFDNKRREKLGLPPVEKTFSEVKKAFEHTGLARVLSTEE